MTTPAHPDREPAAGWLRSPEAAAWRGNPEALARDLRRAVAGKVGFDRGSRALYATDASNYRMPPLGVVWPRSAEDAVRAVEVCRRHGAPVLPRGGGTSLAGQCCNVAVVLDFSRHMDRVLEIDPERRLAWVEPGCVLDTLRRAAAEHGLTFGPDPATHAQCTVGGMIGNNSCGVHSVMAGRTSDNVHELEVLTYDGARFTVGPTDEPTYRRILEQGGRRAEIHRALRQVAERHGDAVRRRFPSIPRRVSGYNLDDLLPENGFHVARSLVGSEATLALVLSAVVHLVPARGERVLLVVSYDDAYAAADHVPEILEAGPIGLEGMDARLLSDQRTKGLNADSLHLLPRGDGWLLVELGADDRGEAAADAHRLAGRLRTADRVVSAEVYEDPAVQARIWQIRESGLGATSRVPGQGDTWAGWEDSAVDPTRFGDYLRALRRLMDRHGLSGSFYGHFGDGCLHTRIDFDLTSEEGLATYRRFVDEATDLVMEHGGVCSGEHGDGQARGELLPRLYGEEIVRAFRQVKGAWDPANRMNPGKVVDPYPILSHLRLGTDYDPWEPETAFAYRDDDGRFSRAALRCVGVGKCRREDDAGTMCPSYRATRDEKHSTRGRARLLFEMLRGELIEDGWASREVAEALDLCLACKACKSECPAGVDMATYKAELRSHRRGLRPPSAYAFGGVHVAAVLASRAPGLANALARTPGLSHLVKAAAGVAQGRRLPRLARRPFRRRFATLRPGSLAGRAGRGAAGAAGTLASRHAAGDGEPPRVILWPDTFNDHFHPEVPWAAVEVLETAGFAVTVPKRESLCCGRPLYDQGFLGTAKRLLRHTLDELGEEIDAGVPLVALEPSCLAVFRDELVNLLPDDERARRLSENAYTLAELLAERGDGFRGPSLAGRALFHGHCHQEALGGTRPDRELLAGLGLEVEAPDTGCCGMAGAFGFERGKVAVSRAVGERVLLPAVRSAGAADLVVADGFSCREQIAQETDRRALHTAQVLQLALGAPEAGGLGEHPERRYEDEVRTAWPWLAAVAAALATLGAVLWRRRKGDSGSTSD